jgi:hypothetical protein
MPPEPSQRRRELVEHAGGRGGAEPALKLVIEGPDGRTDQDSSSGGELERAVRIA